MTAEDRFIARLIRGWKPRRDGLGFLQWWNHDGHPGRLWEPMTEDEAAVYHRTHDMEVGTDE